LEVFYVIIIIDGGIVIVIFAEIWDIVGTCVDIIRAVNYMIVTFINNIVGVWIICVVGYI
jgi:hypothetical protein